MEIEVVTDEGTYYYKYKDGNGVARVPQVGEAIFTRHFALRRVTDVWIDMETGKARVFC